MSTTWSITKPSIMCSTAPTIPADLVYHILDHLWNDPWTLFNCALTCRTWRDASRRLLKRGHVLTINNFENLDRISRLLNNKKTRHFYRDLQQLYIADDKEKPFLHILPLRLPGSLLPNVRLLRLSNIDWTSRRPHSSTLAMTTAFAAVIDISIDGSRFGSSADIRQFISAFRNLTALELDGVNILSPVAGPRYLDLSKAACSPVKWLRMENLHLYAIPRGGSTAIAYLVFLNPILDLCSTFTSLSMLHIRRCTFGSFDDLRRFVCCFPRLRQLKMMDVGWDTTFPRRLTLPLLDEGPGLLRLDTFHARVASYTHGDRLLQWLATSLPNHTLESLDIRPCSASLVGRTLRAIGGSLERLTLYTTASDEAVTVQTIYGKTSRYILQIRISVRQDTPTLQVSRLAMLQALSEFDGITCEVRRIDLRINTDSQTFVPHDPFSTGQGSFGKKTAGSVIGSPIFASVERVTVDLERYPLLKGTETSALREARDEIRHLLSGWDSRGVLYFSYPSCYSDSGDTTRENVDIGEDVGVDDWAVWRDS